MDANHYKKYNVHYRLPNGVAMLNLHMTPVGVFPECYIILISSYLIFLCQANQYALFLHDIVYLYIMTANYTLTNGKPEDLRNGTLMFRNAQRMSFEGL